ncbi:hypothetical protein CK203_092888 [Vitis vinifera]|uniref:Uncharacterized protein n=1 Tax=Vitis vinifera TaxID=29760 RepID=A0A438E2T2_VITVI|nr:hypothetical protein CK203_092888 [Vitis vinifera]
MHFPTGYTCVKFHLTCPLYTIDTQHNSLTCSYNRYSSLFAYGQSKLANVLHANELARRFKVLDLLLDKNEIGNNFMAITN